MYLRSSRRWFTENVRLDGGDFIFERTFIDDVSLGHVEGWYWMIDYGPVQRMHSGVTLGSLWAGLFIVLVSCFTLFIFINLLIINFFIL